MPPGRAAFADLKGGYAAEAVAQRERIDSAEAKNGPTMNLQEYSDEFRAAVTAIPEIVEVYRLTGNVDYIMKIVLPNVEHYDVIYKRLVARIELFEMSAYISMETLKFGTAVPTRYA